MPPSGDSMDSSTTSVIPQILAQLPVLVALLAASAFCSASEAALFSDRKSVV